MEWMLLPYKRYADFQGRSRRKEYWMFALLLFLVSLVVNVLAHTIGGYNGVDFRSLNPLGMLLFALNGLFSLATFIPALAVSVRRLHDQDKSGWLVLVGLIPLLGAIVLLVLFCLDGTKGANKYGADPKGNDADTFA